MVSAWADGRVYGTRFIAPDVVKPEGHLSFDAMGRSATGRAPAIAVLSGTAHMVHTSWNNGQRDLYYKVWNGEQWSRAARF